MWMPGLERMSKSESSFAEKFCNFDWKNKEIHKKDNALLEENLVKLEGNSDLLAGKLTFFPGLVNTAAIV